jgi:transposase
LGRRGTVADPVWVNRRLLLTAAEHLSPRQWARLHRMLDDHDPTNEIGAAWGVKERLRMLLAESEPAKIRRRLADYDAAIDAQLPEATRLAETIQTWRLAILVALTEDASNARTEGFNRIIKQTKRVSVNRPSLRGIAEAREVPRTGAGRVDDGDSGVFGEERRWTFEWWLRPAGTG